MASAQFEHSSVLHEELTCPVCLDLYRDPHLLPCGHNFCKACLDRLKRQAERGRVRCPECRESHRGGTNFQKNFKLANIVDDYRRRRRATAAAASASVAQESLSSTMQRVKTGVDVQCDYCHPAAAEASGFSIAGDASSDASISLESKDKKEASLSTLAIKTCLKCEVSMCQNHLKPHLELPAFREHPLTDPMQDFWKRKCLDHDEIYRYYCMDDKMCVCNACTIEGGHSGHTIKTLKNTMKDLKSSLDKQLYRLERKNSMAERKLQEQKDKERQNKKFRDDAEGCLTLLEEDMKTRVQRFILTLREYMRTQCETNGSAIQKNISKICQDQARLQEVRCGIESLMQENDPFHFVEAYKTTGKQCRKQLRKNMFYPEYIEMETEILSLRMEEEMSRFLDDLPCHIISGINSLCSLSDPTEEEDHEENEEEAAEDEDDDEDDLDDSSEDEIRSDEEEEEVHDNDLADHDLSPWEEEEEGEEEEEVLQWRGPDDLQLGDEGGSGSSRVLAVRGLRPDTVWGPFPGILQSEGSAEEQSTENSGRTLLCDDADCWLNRLPLTSDPSAANCSIYSRGEELYCKLTREIAAGEQLVAVLSPPPPPSSSSSSLAARLSPPLSLVTQKQPALKEEPQYPSALRSDIQLLPQQAGMAAILATAVVNKDIFPCKDCGIWYRSERNLQAHLMYYCASRQKQPAAASSPPQEKPKESYPNERICPFPQCNKSCPSASSLEIHMRTHSGERPFVCLICLSAFTTKANCERHLKVHTDILSGVCHGCGFVSTTRDILYSHLVTSHMVCQPGSRSEVYSPGPGLPKLPLSIGLSPGDSGVVLKCQVCGHNSDSPAQLQQHVRTHLEVRVPTERSPTPRHSTPPSAEPSPHDREALACVPKPDSSSPGANGGSATPRDPSPPDAQTSEVKIKEEPQSESETEEQQMEWKEDGEEEVEGGENRCQKAKEEPATSSSCQTSNSPKSPPNSTVKAEPTSPTPGSSPAHVGGVGSALGGAMFLPQYMFNPEAAILPQASEILAKMSEMVHSRLKQGQAVVQNNSAAFFPSGPTAAAATATPPQKGATCFECDITFNNINNYYAHKRLYCSSRHQGEAAGLASGSGSSGPAPSASSGPQASSPQIAASSRAASVSPNSSEPPSGTGAAESKRLVEVKTETPAGREGASSSSEGEGGGGGRASEGSQSPASGSTEDLEDDPNKTFCEACNIRFSRHDNYTIHKRFYCASRHDPSNHRAGHMSKNSNATAVLPQPIRTRKRKKMYEIHMARTEALATAAAATASAPSPSVLGLVVKQEVSPGGAGSSSPEGDGPIDLSKRPRLKETPRHSGGAGILPALPLTDYHKCTACSISFNSIENYLAHKTYYCPATTLQPHTMEQLHRLKRSASTSPKSRPQQERLDLQHPTEAKALPAEWVARAQGASPSPRPSALPSSGAASPSHTGATLAATPGAGAKGAGPGSLVVCPYCPNRPITCDLMEHFKTAHGLVLAIQPPPENLPRPSRALSCSPSLSPRDGAAPTPQAKPASRVHRDSINGQNRSAAASPISPQVNGSPSAGGSSPSAASPLPVSPPRAPSVTVSPEPLREKVAPTYLPESAAPTAAVHPVVAVSAGPKTAVISPVQNGNSRFCRLCNIKFSSLSTFIAHKKYYCSSHSAEHVK